MISRVVIQGFRGVLHTLTFDMGRITLFSGRNGLGKTTIFDAIDWCLFGSAWRLGESNEVIRNLYSPHMEPYVAVTLHIESGKHTIERTEAGPKLNGADVSDRELLLAFVRDPDIFPPYARDIESRVRRIIYLTQAEMRDIIEPASGSERVALVHSLLGVPNASLVQSGIRRVSERISERQRTLRENLDSVRNDIQAVSLQTPVLDQAGMDKQDSVVRRAKNELGVTARDIDSVDGLANLSRDELQKLRGRRILLENLKVFLIEANAKRTSLLRQNHEREILITAEQENLRKHLEALEQATFEGKNKQNELRGAEERVQYAANRLDEARLMLSRIAELGDARVKLAQQREALKVAHKSVERAQRAINEKESKLLRSKLSLQALSQNMGEIVERQTKSQQIRDINSRISSLQVRLQNKRDALNHTIEQSVELERRASQVQNLYENFKRDYDSAISASPSADRLAALLSEVRTITEQSKSLKCPLCGFKYRSRKELMEHIQTTLSLKGQEVQKVAELRNKVDECHNMATEIARELTNLHLQGDALRIEENALMSELQRLTTEREALGAEEVEEALVQEREAAIELYRAEEVAISRLEQELSETREVLHGADLEVQRVRDGLILTEGRLNSLLQEVSAKDPDYSIDRARNEIQMAEKEHAAASAGKVDIDRQRRAALAAEEQARDRVSEARTRIAELHARSEAAIEQLNSIEREIQQSISDVLAGADQHDVSASVNRALDGLADRETALREVCSALDAAVMFQRQEEGKRQLAVLHDAESRVIDHMEEVNRAKSRFESLVRVVEDRSRTEAAAALKQQEAAIQECLTALYPHRHLDRVELESTRGDILLSDQYLSAAVRPDLYASTGQLNVLALAAFIGISLRQRVSRLGVLLLDEPVQNLDDIHFLAFMTLIKRVAMVRQVVLSTADKNIAELFRRQMKSTWAREKGHYVQYEWRDFDPKEGPDVVRTDPVVTLRVATA